MTKILLWGIGEDYEGIVNLVKYEINKGNISVEGLVARKEDIYCNKKDGFRCIEPDKVLELDFSYIVITSTKYYNFIRQTIISIGLSDSQIINGEVFKIPNFDFASYELLLENPVTIISDDCWGGYAYNKLHLKFTSPFVNTLIDHIDYCTLIGNLDDFLKSDLQMVEFGDICKGIHPVGRLESGAGIVNIQFVHNIDFMEAYEQFCRRKKRININNYFVKMGFAGSIDQRVKEMSFHSFEELQYKKILFYYGDVDMKNVFKTQRFIWAQKHLYNRVDTFDYNAYLRNNYRYDINLIDLLNGCEYSRI